MVNNQGNHINDMARVRQTHLSDDLAHVRQDNVVDRVAGRWTDPFGYRVYIKDPSTNYNDPIGFECHIDQGCIQVLHSHKVPRCTDDIYDINSTGFPDLQQCISMCPTDDRHPRNTKYKVPRGINLQTQFPACARDGKI